MEVVFVISGIIKVEVSVISLGLLAQLNTLTLTLIFPDITKTKAKNCFIIHCFEINNNKCTVAQNWFDIALGNHALCAQPTG